MTGTLYRNGKSSLMLSAVSRYPSGKDLASLGNILLKSSNIFVIQSLVLSAEHTYLLASVDRISPSYGSICSITIALWFTKSHNTYPPDQIN